MLIDTIKIDRLQARRAGDTALAQLLTTFYSEASMVGKNDGNRSSTDSEVHAVAKKFIKNANEVLANLPADDARALGAVYEIDILARYLPPQLSEQELFDAIEDLIQTNNVQSIKDMGFVMTELKAYYDGQFDGKLASQITRELLK